MFIVQQLPIIVTG